MSTKFYDYSVIDGYQKMFNLIVTPRAVGKSFGAKSNAVKHFLKTGRETIFLFRYENDIQLMNHYFDDINEIVFPDKHFVLKGNVFYIDNKEFALLLALSTAYKQKRNSLYNFDRIISDEFLAEGGARYLTDEFNSYLTLCDTIDRRRGILKAYLLSNAISISNPYFNGFDVSLPVDGKSGFYFPKDKNKSVILDYRKEGRRDSTEFSKTVSDTKYGNYANDADFFADNVEAVETPKTQLVFLFTYKYGDMFFHVWHSPSDYKIFVTQSNSIINSNKTYTVGKYEISEAYTSANIRNTSNVIRKALTNATLRFKDIDTKNRFYDVLKVIL